MEGPGALPLAACLLKTAVSPLVNIFSGDNEIQLSSGNQAHLLQFRTPTHGAISQMWSGSNNQLGLATSMLFPSLCRVGVSCSRHLLAPAALNPSQRRTGMSLLTTTNSQGTPNITNEVELGLQFIGFWQNFITTFSMQGYTT